ncbi:hypothetical protein LXA43DRAFT_667256 [Ganoderma leucocontextum]|nr:hypothetical protein LXA43DRAFT_667256 [Ganoderma leucocontextum]
MPTTALALTLHKNHQPPFNQSPQPSLPSPPHLTNTRRTMSSIHNSLYGYDFYSYDHSDEALEESVRAAADDLTHTKTNQPSRTSSLTNIDNLPGPSSTTANHHPASPPYASYPTLWDENSFSFPDIPLIDHSFAPPPPPSVLRPLYLCPFIGFEGRVMEDAPSVRFIPQGHPPIPGIILEHLSMSTDADGVRYGDYLAEVGYAGNPASPSDAVDLGETEGMWGRRQLGLLMADTDTLQETTAGPSVLAPKFSDEPTTETSSPSGVDAMAEPLRRRRPVKLVVEDTPTAITSSRKGKGKETSSTSSMVARGSKRKHEEGISTTVEDDSAPAPGSKRQKVTPEEVEKAMVPPRRLPTKCGCGTKFSEPSVSGIVKHFATHYNAREKTEKAKVQCRWGKCATALTYGELVRHVRADHVGVRWPCPDCGQQFTRPNGVTRHKKSVSACTKNQGIVEGRM